MFVGTILSYLLAKERKSYIQIMEEIEILPPKVDSESVAILKEVNKASRALGQLKGEVSKIPNSQILLDTLTLQEAKDSNEIENIVTTDDEKYMLSAEEIAFIESMIKPMV